MKGTMSLSYELQMDFRFLSVYTFCPVDVKPVSGTEQRNLVTESPLWRLLVLS